MIAFGLDDLKEGPLKGLANQLGIPHATTLTSADAVKEIKSKLAPNSALIFVPLLPGNSSSAQTWGLKLAIGSLLISLIVAIATWLGTIAAVNKNTAEQREEEELAWQTTIVYKIIDEASKASPNGISFSDINLKYVGEATAAEGIHLERSKLQPTELRRILMGLLGDKLVIQTAEDSYIVLRTLIVHQGGDALVYEVNRATGSILQALSSDPGRYTEKELEGIIREKAKVSSEAYLIAVTSLLAAQGAVLDKDNKLWSAANPPPADKMRKGPQ